jgi:acyl-coenzyme A synthetase/AMP-(fatty) acid ligase
MRSSLTKTADQHFTYLLDRWGDQMPSKEEWRHTTKLMSQGFFSLDIPEEVNMAHYTVDFWAAHGRSEEVAIYNGDETITYGQLKDMTDALAFSLDKLGIGKGDRVILRTPNIPEFPMVFLALHKIGAVPIPTNIMFREYEFKFICENSEAVAIVSTEEHIDFIEKFHRDSEKLKHVITIGTTRGDQISFAEMIEKGKGKTPPEVRTSKDDPAFFLYTSGTTGPPKGVVHCHRWLIGTGDPLGKFVLDLQPSDVVGGPTPLTWMYALGCNFLYPFRWGASTAMYTDDRFNPERAFEFIEKYKITAFTGSPTIFRMMLAVKNAEKRYDTSSLRYCTSSGEPLLAHTWKEWKKRFGVTILDCMGQTECHIFCSTQLNVPVKIGSMGKPPAGIEVAIVSAEGEVLPVGETGTLAISADYPGLFKEYFKTPELTEEVWMPNGWYDTKDLAYMDADGYFWYVSRSDDIMTCYGYRISPADVETALQEHPAVLESAVAGIKDPEAGEKVKAWIVLNDGYEGSPDLAKQLQDHVKSTIAPYKYPREIEFLSELPKTVTGKMLRRQLRSEK